MDLLCAWVCFRAPSCPLFGLSLPVRKPAPPDDRDKSDGLGPHPWLFCREVRTLGPLLSKCHLELACQFVAKLPPTAVISAGIPLWTWPVHRRGLSPQDRGSLRLHGPSCVLREPAFSVQLLHVSRSGPNYLGFLFVFCCVVNDIFYCILTVGHSIIWKHGIITNIVSSW